MCVYCMHTNLRGTYYLWAINIQDLSCFIFKDHLLSIHMHCDCLKEFKDLIFVDDKKHKQVLMFYHLKTMRYVNTAHI